MCQYLLIRNRCICSCRRCRGGQYSRRWQSKGGGPCLLWWCGAGRGLAASVTRPKTENIFPFPKKIQCTFIFQFKVRAHCTDFVREGAAGLSPGLCVSAHFFSNAKILMLSGAVPLPVASDMTSHHHHPPRQICSFVKMLLYCFYSE